MQRNKKKWILFFVLPPNHSIVNTELDLIVGRHGSKPQLIEKSVWMWTGFPKLLAMLLNPSSSPLSTEESLKESNYPVLEGQYRPFSLTIYLKFESLIWHALRLWDFSNSGHSSISLLNGVLTLQESLLLLAPNLSLCIIYPLVWHLSPQNHIKVKSFLSRSDKPLSYLKTAITANLHITIFCSKPITTLHPPSLQPRFLNSLTS